jgi:hypothetical protein
MEEATVKVLREEERLAAKGYIYRVRVFSVRAFTSKTKIGYKI